MAVTIATVGKPVNNGSEMHRHVDITGPASYTTGGEALSASDLAALTSPAFANATTANLIARIVHFGAEDSTGGYAVSLDRTNKKILYFNGTTQITSTTDLSAVVIRVKVTFGIVS